MKVTTLIIRIYSLFNEVLFEYPRTKTAYRIRIALLVVLFLIGIGHWVSFLGAGKQPLLPYDWGKENVYLNTLREAQVDKRIPLQWDNVTFQDTQNILANPEIVLTPDIVLLRWVSNSIFIIIHVSIFYAIGFLGSLLIAKKLNASFIAYLFFWLVFNFNGYLTSHLAAGHFQWIGYFLLPFFFIILSRFVAESQNMFSVDIVNTLYMGLLLGLLFLNGSFHIAIWLLMFMVITLLWKWSMLLNVIVAIITGILLGFSRLFPAILYGPPSKGFILGYDSFASVLAAFTSLYSHDRYLWWEYDIFIGFVAFITLTVSFGVALKRRKYTYQLPILAAAGLFFMLSLGNVYALIAKLPFPFANIERVPSRFIIIPFVVFLIIAMTGIDELFRFWPRNSKVATLVVLPFIAYELALHSFHWRINHLSKSLLDRSIPAPFPLSSNPDPAYALSVYVGWLVSFTSLFIVVIILFRNRHNSLKVK